jgi:hypothetical protein
MLINPTHAAKRMLPRRTILALYCLGGLFSQELPAQGPSRYVARLASGRTIEGQLLTNWHSSGLMPQLDQQPLFDPANPIRWLMDRKVPPPVLPAEYVEMVTGDRLPGRLIEFRSGTDFPFQPSPAHFVIQSAGSSGPGFEVKSLTQRIDARYARRIAWRQSVGDPVPYEPRTALLNAGNRIRFRSIRFSRSEAILLVADGVRRIPFSDLAELHLATGDFWSLYLDELADLAPDGQRRFLQYDCASGLLATTTLDRCLPRAVGDERDVNRWMHGIQPAWSLDVIWVPQADVWMRRCWSPQEVPLSRVPPHRDVHQSLLGKISFPARVNRNVEGGLLRCGSDEAGWGIGVHAFSRLEYELPALARTFHCSFGIDATMRAGGCVKAQVFSSLNDREAPVYESQPLVGSNAPIATGRMALTGNSTDNRHLVLQVDPMAENRPSGADPLDIRDHANWVEPLVELDAVELERQLPARAARLFPCWRGWNVSQDPGGKWQWFHHYYSHAGTSGIFQRAVAVNGNPLKLSLTRQLIDQDRWLVIDAVRATPQSDPVRCTVRIDADDPIELDLPLLDASGIELRPLIMPLHDRVKRDGRSTVLEVTQMPSTTPVVWRMLGIVSEHPLLACVFEDDLPAENKQQGAADSLQAEIQEAYSGRRSVRVGSAEPLRLPLVRPTAIRERPQLGEFRYLKLAIRQPGAGGIRLSLEPAAAGSPAFYEAANNSASTSTTQRLTTHKLGSEWLVVTRDLYGDWGTLDLTALSLQVLGNDPAWVDHVYLARTLKDFEIATIGSTNRGSTN